MATRHRVIAALFGIFVASTAGAAVLLQASPTLVAYYDFEAGAGTTATDASGNGNTGTLMGGAAFAPGIAPAVPTGNASSIQIPQATSNSRVQVPHAPPLSFTGPFTIAAWVRPTSYPGAQLGIIEKWDWTGSNINGYFIRLSSTGVPSFSIGYGSTQNYASAGPALGTNIWTHVAGVYDGATMTLYVGGTSRASIASAVPQASTAALHIGSDYGDNRFQGQIDEVRLFNAALSPAQINILINGMPAPTLTSLVSPAGFTLVATWTSVPGATGYTILRGTAPGVLSPIATVGPLETSYTDTTVAYPTRYYYAVVANGIMTSGRSNELNEVPMADLPRFNDHEEGFKDRNCGCGTAAAPGPGLAAMAVLAALAGLLARRAA